jgi:hypothetical protein
MSDHWIVLIPTDPRFVPEPLKREQALERFSAMAPEAEELECKVAEEVQFFDCGQNFERVLCPICKTVLPMEWWEAQLETDAVDDGFRLDKYVTPCCGASCSLDELQYEWTQGFARFSLEAMNPDLGELQDDCKQELESILGTKLRVIYQHL